MRVPDKGPLKNMIRFSAIAPRYTRRDFIVKVFGAQGRTPHIPTDFKLSRHACILSIPVQILVFSYFRYLNTGIRFIIK